MGPLAFREVTLGLFVLTDLFPNMNIITGHVGFKSDEGFGNLV
jgi:hypothetical protein